MRSLAECQSAIGRTKASRSGCRSVSSANDRRTHHNPQSESFGGGSPSRRVGQDRVMDRVTRVLVLQLTPGVFGKPGSESAPRRMVIRPGREGHGPVMRGCSADSVLICALQKVALRYINAMAERVTNRETEAFSMAKCLQDPKQGQIAVRIDRLRLGTPEMLSQLAKAFPKCGLHHGPGYRVYYAKIEQVIVLLLCGGNKKTQARDVKTAKALRRRLP